MAKDDNRWIEVQFPALQQMGSDSRSNSNVQRQQLGRGFSGSTTVPGNSLIRIKGTLLINDGTNDRVMIGKFLT